MGAYWTGTGICAHESAMRDGKVISIPAFEKVAEAYDIDYYRAEKEEDIERLEWDARTPKILEIRLENITYVFPKLEYGRPNQDQEPLLDRGLYDDMMKLDVLEEIW